MKQVALQRGLAVADDVPAPMVESGTALVLVERSCISIGTELSGLNRSALPLWRLALRYPEQVKKTVETVATLGLSRTWSLVQGQLSAGTPVGYSAAGVVHQVGDGLADLRPGDRVACAGAQFAHHAEAIRVPRNLIARIPDQVSFDEASTVALGAIALQGVRRAQPTLGETFVVIGLGAIGQITAQILRANGCQVIGVDLDRGRIALAEQLGMNASVPPDREAAVSQVTRLTGGIGADGVIVTAASASDEIISTAFAMCRRKGRVVLVGDVGLDVKRSDIYQKELDFFISCSYGPGRYDSTYEDGGRDYPIGYVRWTEKRNMEEYLRLLSERRVRVAPLMSAIYPVHQARAAYETLQSESRPLMVLLSYPGHATEARLATVVQNPRPLKSRPGVVRLALVGAGNFAKGMHLPNIQALADKCHLQAVISRTGHNAMATARRWGAAYAGTDFQRVLDDQDVDAVIIATRHHLHAPMALAALRAGKHVLLEKPMALSESELASVLHFFAGGGISAQMPILMTGFNRRFSPSAVRIREWSRQRSNPMILNYRMNAGFIPGDHWVHSSEGGGRNLGEACHIYDLFTYLTGARVTGVQTSAIRPQTAHYQTNDNFTTTISFADGSVGTLTYTALGCKEHPKEQLEVFVDGKVITLNDYKTLTIAGAKGQPVRSRVPEKGQKEELAAFIAAIQGDGEWPIALWEQVQATRIALEVESALNRER